MRIVSWNCCRGDFESRFGQLESLDPDIAIIQECSRSKTGSPNRRWAPVSSNRGIGVRVPEGYSITRLGADRPLHRCVHGYHICGPTSFNLLAVWSHDPKRRDYRSPWANGIRAYEPHLKGQPLVVAGDFNDHPRWDDDYREPFISVLERVCNEHNLVSAYHHFYRQPHKKESRFTHLNNRTRKRYHIDYVLVPKVWRVKEVIIESRIFDHAPVIVDARTSLADKMKFAGLSHAAAFTK